MFRMQMIFFLHSEEFFHEEMGNCYSPNHVLYL